MLLGFWRGFSHWNDYDVVVANAARTANAVEMANRRMRVQTRSYFDTYFNVIGDKESASEPLPEVSEEYPREEVSALEVYMRPYKEYHYNKAKMERERAANDERIAKIRADIAGKKPRAELEKEIEALRKDLETPEQRDARRAAKLAAAAEEVERDLANSPSDDEGDWTDDDFAELDEELERIASNRPSDESLQEQAEKLMEERLKKMADTDVQMARRNEVYDYLANKSKVIGFRRIIHPELSESGVCGVCGVAASRIYGKADLEPIHVYCKCEVLPITKDHDPGKTLNREELDAFYRDAGGNDIDVLSNTRYKVDEHGELGLVLTEKAKKTVERQKKDFSGPKATPTERRAFNRKDPHFHQRRDIDELFVLYGSFERLMKRVMAGENNLRPTLQWEAARIQFLEGRMNAVDIRQARQDKMVKRPRAKGSETSVKKLTPKEFSFGKKNIQSEIDSLEKTLAELIRITASGVTDRSQAITWQQNRLALLRKMLSDEQANK